MLEDRVLVWKLKRGSSDAVRRIYDKYKRDMVSLANALLQDLSGAEDVVHDVFVSFVQSAEEFKLTGSLKGYLLTCVANQSRDRVRAKRRGPKELNDGEIAATKSNAASDNVIAAEQSERLKEAIARVPYEQREVVIMHLQAGKTFKAIAQLRGLPVGTIQSRYRYGIEKLRALLNSEAEK